MVGLERLAAAACTQASKTCVVGVWRCVPFLCDGFYLVKVPLVSSSFAMSLITPAAHPLHTVLHSLEGWTSSVYSSGSLFSLDNKAAKPLANHTGMELIAHVELMAPTLRLGKFASLKLRLKLP